MVGILAVVVLAAATVAVWARATVFDSNKVADIVEDAITEPDVQAALARYVTDQVFTAVDVRSALSSVVPGELQRLQPVLAAGIRTFVDRTVTTALATPEVQEVMTTLIRRAHSAAMDLLQGDGLVDGVTVVDGAVTLNTLPLLGRALGGLQSLGLFADVELPPLSADGDPDEQIVALGEATGRDLPDDLGQLVVYRSDRLADAQASLQSAQRALVVAKRAVALLVVLTVVLFAATILVARNRWRATLLLGLGAAAAMVVTRSAVHRVVDEAPSLATRPGGQAAISAVVGGASEALLRLAGLLLVLAAVAIVVALLRRRWRRADLYLVAAVVAGLAIVAVLQVSVVSLVIGVAVAIAIVLLAPKLAPGRPAPLPA